MRYPKSDENFVKLTTIPFFIVPQDQQELKDAVQSPIKALSVTFICK